MENVIEQNRYKTVICDLVYGSYSQSGVEVTVPDDYNTEAIRRKIIRDYGLTFLPMCDVKIKIVHSKLLSNDY